MGKVVIVSTEGKRRKRKIDLEPTCVHPLWFEFCFVICWWVFLIFNIYEIHDARCNYHIFCDVFLDSTSSSREIRQDLDRKDRNFLEAPLW